MDEDDKVISLAERLARQKQAPGKPAGERPEGSPAHPPGTGFPDPAEAPGEPVPGKLTWLRCPACGTLQYTEVFMTGGRRHNVCGTQVEEAVVDVDVRAELTIAAINLERLTEIETAVAAQRAHYETYQERLRAMAGTEPGPYPLTEEVLRRLPVAELDALGLLVPTALHAPARRFAPDSPAPSGPADGPTPPGGPTPPKP